MKNSTQKRVNKNKLVTLAEAANEYGFSVDYLRELAQRERLTAEKLGKIWVTTFANVEEFIKSRKKVGVYRKDIGN
ncbi:MAG: hypothetical protein AAF487_14235 [Bacteroidota bacterium]